MNNLTLIPDTLPRRLTNSQLRTLAYKDLGITADEIAWVPEITSELRRIFSTIRKINPNLPGDPYYYLKTCDHPDATAILHQYYYLVAYRRKLVCIEAFCLAAKVPSARCLELIAGACVRIARNASQIVAAVTHPSIVQKTVEMALTDEGYEDRNTLHKAVGFLPTPKGSQINILQNNAPKIETVLPPSLESTVRRLSDRSAKSLPSKSPSLLLPAPMEGFTETVPDSVDEAVEVEAEYDHGTE